MEVAWSQRESLRIWREKKCHLESAHPVVSQETPGYLSV